MFDISIRRGVSRLISRLGSIALLSVLMTGVACSARDSGAADSQLVADADGDYMLYCAQNDCSEFPLGYFSLELNGAWLYLPTRTLLKDLGYSGLSGKLTASSNDGFNYAELSAPDEEYGLQRSAIVIPDVAYLTIGLCCESYGQYYDIDSLKQIRVSQVRLSNRIETSPNLGPPATAQAPSTLPPSFQALSARYGIKLEEVGQLDAPTLGHYRLLAWSKEPLVFGERVLVECFEKTCNVQWGGSGDHLMSGYFIGIQTPCFEDDCWSRSAIESRFERMERFLSGFATMIDRMKLYPGDKKR